MLRSSMTALVFVAALGIALSGCGRKGPLEAPASGLPAPPAADAAVTAVPVPVATQKPAERPPAKPKQPFFLDFLL